MSLERLLYLSDEHLMVVLRQLPNDVLLNSLKTSEAMPIRQRVCEVLSVSAAKMMLEDLEKAMAKPSDLAADPVRSDAYINAVFDRCVSERKIAPESEPLVRRLAS